MFFTTDPVLVKHWVWLGQNCHQERMPQKGLRRGGVNRLRVHYASSPFVQCSLPCFCATPPGHSVFVVTPTAVVLFIFDERHSQRVEGLQPELRVRSGFLKRNRFLFWD